MKTKLSAAFKERLTKDQTTIWNEENLEEEPRWKYRTEAIMLGVVSGLATTLVIFIVF